MAPEVPDDIVHLFAAVGRHDQIVAAIEQRFGGLVDALTLRGEGMGDVPPDLVRTSAGCRTPSVASRGRTESHVRVPQSRRFPFARRLLTSRSNGARHCRGGRITREEA
jgi:hypothetical protein